MSDKVEEFVQNTQSMDYNRQERLKLLCIIIGVYIFLFLALFIFSRFQKKKNKQQKPILIGIVGNKKVGKDTFADYIIEKVHPSSNNTFEKQTFAKPIKDVLKVMLNFSDAQLYDQDYKEKIDEKWGATPRNCMQSLGDLLEEDFPKRFPAIMKATNNQRIVVTILKQFLLSKLLKDKTNIIISDVRRSDEAAMIKDLGGILIKIERPGFSNLGDAKTHISEREISKIKADFVIENNGTIPNLYAKAQDLMYKILYSKDVMLLNQNKNDLPD